MLPTKETVRKTTYRNSRCLALALRAQSRGGPSGSASRSPSRPAGELAASLQGKAAPPHRPTLRSPLHDAASSSRVRTRWPGEVAASPSMWGGGRSDEQSGEQRC
jgi:hypothetical protein